MLSCVVLKTPKKILVLLGGIKCVKQLQVAFSVGSNKLEDLHACQSVSLASVTARLFLSSSSPPSVSSPLHHSSPSVSVKFGANIHGHPLIGPYWSLTGAQSNWWGGGKVWLQGANSCMNPTNILSDFSPLDSWLNHLTRNKTSIAICEAKHQQHSFGGWKLDQGLFFFPFWLGKFTHDSFTLSETPKTCICSRWFVWEKKKTGGFNEKSF